MGQLAVHRRGEGGVDLVGVVAAALWLAVRTLAPRGRQVVVSRGELVEIGKVGGLGKGERIYSVRFIDDIGYVQQDRDEMEVLFTFLAERYERKTVIITSNLVFSAWDRIFKDPMTTACAIDRVVHHSVIVEFGSDITSYRAEEATKRNRAEIAVDEVF